MHCIEFGLRANCNFGRFLDLLLIVMLPSTYLALNSPSMLKMHVTFYRMSESMNGISPVQLCHKFIQVFNFHLSLSKWNWLYLLQLCQCGVSSWYCLSTYLLLMFFPLYYLLKWSNWLGYPLNYSNLCSLEKYSFSILF